MFLTIVLVLLGLWFFQDLFVNGRKLPPGPLRFPIVGTLLQMARMKRKEPAPHKMFQLFSNKYGPILTLQYGMKRQVVINDYKMIRKILSSDMWLNRPTDQWMMERSFGKQLGILWGNGEPWRDVRRFSIRTLRDFGFGKQKGQDVAMQEELDELMQRLDKQLNTEPNSPVCMSQFFTVSVLNILWSMMSGMRFAHDDRRLQKLVTNIYKNTRFLNASGNILMAYPLLRSVLRSLTGVGEDRRKLIAEMQKQFQVILCERRALGDYKEDQTDLIDVFLYEIDKHKGDQSCNNVFTDEQFVTVSLDLFVAGSETTSNSLEFAILYMLLNPLIQDKVRQEIDDIVGRNAFPTVSMKSRMPYTEAVLLEIQRISSVAPMIVRCPSEDEVLSTYRIPKGTYTIINLFSAHMDPNVWENPSEFRPQRFLNTDNEIINTDKMFPFGQGKRICMGEVLARATLFTYFVRFFQNYTVENAPGYPTPTTECVPGLTLAPKPYYALVKKREA